MRWLKWDTDGLCNADMSEKGNSTYHFSRLWIGESKISPHATSHAPYMGHPGSIKVDALTVWPGILESGIVYDNTVLQS